MNSYISFGHQEFVKVKPTDKGHKVWSEYLDSDPAKNYINYSFYDRDTNELSIPVWQFMMAFGPHLIPTNWHHYLDNEIRMKLT